ncbi:Ca(2+)-dependent cysteine protease [Serendipita sp. 405]|nr:Ca(2+)-dependent cysteine protease [Serendipita sp. 405]
MFQWARVRWKRVRNWWSRHISSSSLGETPKTQTPSTNLLTAQGNASNPSGITSSSSHPSPIKTKMRPPAIDTSSPGQSADNADQASTSRSLPKADKIGLIPITHSSKGSPLPVIRDSKPLPTLPDESKVDAGDAKASSENECVVGSPLSDRAPRSRAVLIGIHYLQHKDRSWEELTTPGKDVDNMHKFLVAQGYTEFRILTDAKDNTKRDDLPTDKAIRDGLHWLVDDARDGDRLFLHYSGHGNQIPTDSTSESDGHDEAIVPLRVDGDTVYLLDNDLHDILVRKLPTGCRLMAVFDCCHAGTMLDLPHAHTLNLARKIIEGGSIPFRKTNRLLRRATRRAQTWLVSQTRTSDSAVKEAPEPTPALAPTPREEPEVPRPAPLRRSSTQKSVVVRKTNANIMKLRYSFPEPEETVGRRRSTRLSIPTSPAAGPASGRKSNASPVRPKSDLFEINEDGVTMSPLAMSPLRAITASPRSSIDETMIPPSLPMPSRKNTSEHSRPTKGHSFHEFSSPGSEDAVFHEMAQIVGRDVMATIV